MHAVTGSGRLIAGRYRLQGPIGRGAMGIVWRGRDELLARDVAVKEVHITAQASPADAETIYQRTLREARTAARLSHPGVVTVYDVLEENGSPWIIMALVEARSLDRVIAEDGPLPPHQAARIGASLVAALAAAHAAGVLHRDVKPSNVLVTTDGTAVLTDFGIATFAGDPGITQAGMVVGTPGFTAPERVRGDAATPASDLWSVGATLFAAVEGRGPFDRAGGPAAITTGIATEDAPRAPSAGPLAPVIGSLLSRDPAARPKAAAAARLLAAAAAAGATGETAVAGAANGAARPGAPEPDASTFLDPPVYSELSISDVTKRGTVLDVPADDPQPAGAVAGLAASGLAVGGLTDAPEVAGARAGSAAEPPAAAAVIAAADTDASPAAPYTAAAADTGDRSAGSLATADGTAGHGTAGPGVAAAVIAAADAADRLAGAPVAAASPARGGVVPAAGPGPERGGADGPIYWQPIGPGTGERSAAAPADGADSAPGPGSAGSDGGSGGLGALRFWQQGGPGRPSPQRSRLLAGAGLAAIVLAALIGWAVYSPDQSPQALQSTAPVGASAGGSGQPAPGGSKPPGASGAATAPASGSSAATTTAHGQLTGAGSSPSTATGTGIPSPSISATPSPSPTPSTPILPPGWDWHRFTAAALASAAGFRIGLPAACTQDRSGQVAYFTQALREFHLSVSVAPWAHALPLAQAAYLQHADSARYHGYTKLLLGSAGFRALGGDRTAPAAELKFRWQKPGTGSFTELVVLVTLTTTSGAQPYAFTLWAPSAEFGAAQSTLQTALGTFRPLPGA